MGNDACCDLRDADLDRFGNHYHLTNDDGSAGRRLDPRKMSTCECSVCVPVPHA